MLCYGHPHLYLITALRIPQPINNQVCDNPDFKPKLPIKQAGKINETRHKDACVLGAVSIRKTVLPGMAIPMLKIRRPNGCLIFNIGIAIPR